MSLVPHEVHVTSHPSLHLEHAAGLCTGASGEGNGRHHSAGASCPLGLVVNQYAVEEQGRGTAVLAEHRTARLGQTAKGRSENSSRHPGENSDQSPARGCLTAQT